MENNNEETVIKTDPSVGNLPILRNVLKFLYFLFLLAVICAYKYLTEGNAFPSLIELLLLVLSVDIASIASTLYKSFLTNSFLAEAKIQHMKVTAGFFSMIAVIIGELGKLVEQNKKK